MEIKMPRMKFLMTLLSLYAKAAVEVLAFLVLVGIVLGAAIDARFFVIALMIIFIVAPMLMAFLYIYYGLHPHCAFNAATHTLSETDGGFLIDFPTEEENLPKPKPLFINKEDLGDRIIDGTATLYLFKNRKGFLWIPQPQPQETWE